MLPVIAVDLDHGRVSRHKQALPYADRETANLIMFMNMRFVHSTEWTFEPQNFRTDSHLGCFMLCCSSLRQ